MAEYTTSDIVSAALSKDAVTIKAAVDDIMLDKVAAHVEARREAVAADMFGSTVAQSDAAGDAE